MRHSNIKKDDILDFEIISKTTIRGAWDILVYLHLNGRKFIVGHGRGIEYYIAYQIAKEDALNKFNEFMKLHNIYLQLTGENTNEV